MDIGLFAGKIKQWRFPGDPASSSDLNAPGKDLSQGQYFAKTNSSPQINLLIDLIICSTTKIGFLAPCAVEDRDLDAIFNETAPKVKNDKREKWLVGAIGGSDGEHQPVLKIYHDDDAEPPQEEAERGLGNGS